MSPPNFTFVWHIKNFSFCNQMKDKSLDSPKFTAFSLKNTEWFLRLYPRGRIFDCYIPCFLRRTNCTDGPPSIEIDYILTVISADGTVMFLRETNGHTFRRGTGFGFPDFVKRDDIYNKQQVCLPEDTLTIKCQMWAQDNDAATPTYCSGCTQIGFDTRCYTWSIKDFTMRNWRQKLTIPAMTASKSLSDLGISFLVNSSDDYLHILIPNINKNEQENLFMKCEIVVLDSGGNPCDSKKEVHLFTDDENEWEFPLFIRKCKLTRKSEKYLPNDTLTLRCTLDISSGIELEKIEKIICGPSLLRNNNSVDENVMNVSCKNHYSLKNDIYRLYLTQKFCDMVIRTGNTRILVHKAIVCSRSPVISDLVENDPTVKLSGVVDLPDIDSKTLNRMVTFMYSDNLEHVTSEDSRYLYLAAEKYKMHSLKEVCLSVMITNLSVGNVCDILAFAKQHKDTKLKMASIEFVCENSAEVFLSAKWNRFMAEWVELASETMHHVCLKKS